MAEAVIVDILRTPFSRSRPRQPERDVYNKIRMDETLARIVGLLVERNSLKGEDINDLIVGCAMQMKEQWLMGGKTIALLAGLPVSVPSAGADRQCISGMSAIQQGAMELMLGYSDAVICCGMEHMTHLPLDPTINTDLMMVNPKFFTEERFQKMDMMTAMNMGLTAEKLAGMSGIGREAMDEFSLASHLNAAKAFEDGYFAAEFMPVEAEQEDGSVKLIDRDLAVRADSTIEGMQELQPAFKADGCITAGNASPLNAGAVAVLMMSADKAKAQGIKPLAKVIGMGWAGVDPSIMGAGPVPSSKRALDQLGLKADEIDFWEINEAFAVVSLYAMKEFNIPAEKVNVHGGAVAIGHPLACSGPRITGTLARILQEKDGKYGLATMCGGGGQGGTVILEKA
jgi:acetyl-CoA C-acetyltransferase